MTYSRKVGCIFLVYVPERRNHSTRQDPDLTLKRKKEVMLRVKSDSGGRSTVHSVGVGSADVVGERPVIEGGRFACVGAWFGIESPTPRTCLPSLYDHDWPWIISRLWGE